MAQGSGQNVADTVGHHSQGRHGKLMPHVSAHALVGPALFLGRGRALKIGLIKLRDFALVQQGGL